MKTIVSPFTVTTLQEQVFTEIFFWHSLGCSVIPLKPGKKMPRLDVFNQRKNRFTLEQLTQIFSAGDSNVGIITGKASNNLTVLDFDDKEQGEKFYQYLLMKGIRTLTRTSGRGIHIYFYLQEGLPQKGKLPAFSLDILSENSICLVGGIHPTEKDLLQFVHIEEKIQTIPLSIFTTYGIHLTLVSEKRKKEFHPQSKLPIQAHKVLVDKQFSIKHNNGTPDYSANEFGACKCLLENGFTPEETYKTFQKYNPPHFQKMTEKSFYAEYVYWKSHTNTDTHYNSENKYLCLIDYLSKNKLSDLGRRETNCSLILSAIAHICATSNEDSITHAIRTIALECNLTPKTVQQCIHALSDQNYIRIFHEKNRANKYTIIWQKLDNIKHSIKIENQLIYDFTPNNVYCHGELGGIGKRILQNIEGKTYTELKELELCSTTTLKNKLKYMRDNGIVICDNRKYRLILNKPEDIKSLPTKKDYISNRINFTAIIRGNFDTIRHIKYVNKLTTNYYNNTHLTGFNLTNIITINLNDTNKNNLLWHKLTSPFDGTDCNTRATDRLDTVVSNVHFSDPPKHSIFVPNIDKGVIMQGHGYCQDNQIPSLS